ncbi:hypothetical protein EVAR_19517_1 [Eumeta japonica]|uniref:Uncharacterized protein n=1 Tax=Eumeta variegata TaxID=151549 RepID=A0A4C1UFZ2_EUMVA|nr:hypothetical protein EVAR_19517_1 [Eumeta japonica]
MGLTLIFILGVCAPNVSKRLEKRDEFWTEDTVVDDNATATEYMIDDGNESEITLYEIVKAIKHMKVEKAAGYDRVSSKTLRGDRDIEKVYDRVKRIDLWKTLSMHGVSSRLIEALQSLYKDSSACVRINGAYTDWLDIRGNVRQGYVASLWLFNLFLDSYL